MIGKQVLKATFFALIAGLILSISSGLVVADFTIPSGPPHAFYGNLLINEAPAQIGTIVEARGTGVSVTIGNPIYTDVEGKYGTSGATGDKLVVQGDDTLVDGTIITFYVNDVSTEQTYIWQSGNITELALSVTIPVITGGVSGGGGGGGGVPREITTNLFGSEDYFRISNLGRILEKIVITSPDGKLTITIPVNTIARDSLGNPLSSLTVDVDLDPPCPLPEDERIIGLAYTFRPDGATFIPPIEIVFTYELDEIPEGVIEAELIVAFCDEDSEEWIQVPAIVDEDNNTVTAQISHFTTYAVIGKGILVVEEEEPETIPEPAPEPAPAVFSTISMSVLPTEVNPGETVVISVIVTNTGDKGGTHDIILNVNDVKEDSKALSLNAGESKEVSFTVLKDKPGIYQIECNGLQGSFVVKEAVVEPVTPAPGVTPAPEVTGEGIQWWIWVIIATVVCAVVVVGLYFYGRRAKA